MRRTLFILFIFIAFFNIATDALCATDKLETLLKEYQVKVAFLYNFFNFIEWPQEKFSDSDESVVIGIIGQADPKVFQTAFEPLTKKKVQGKQIVLQIFNDLSPLSGLDDENQVKRNELIESMKQCHILMFCKYDENHIDTSPAILSALKGTPVLTVGECSDFVDEGGNINFVNEDRKIRFEINLAVAKENHLTIRSKLLKLAKRVVE